jgi:hypothetical protein
MKMLVPYTQLNADGGAAGKLELIVPPIPGLRKLIRAIQFRVDPDDAGSGTVICRLKKDGAVARAWFLLVDGTTGARAEADREFEAAALSTVTLEIERSGLTKGHISCEMAGAEG